MRNLRLGDMWLDLWLVISLLFKVNCRWYDRSPTFGRRDGRRRRFWRRWRLWRWWRFWQRWRFFRWGVFSTIYLVEGSAHLTIDGSSQTLAPSLFPSSPITSRSSPSPPHEDTCSSPLPSFNPSATESIARLQFYSDLDDISTSSPLLLSDNQSALALTGDAANYQRAKHIDIRYHFIRDAIAKVKLLLIIFLRRINRRTFSPKLSVLNFINCVWMDSGMGLQSMSTL